MKGIILVLLGIFFGIAQVAMGQCNHRELAKLKKELKGHKRAFKKSCGKFAVCVSRAEDIIRKQSTFSRTIKSQGCYQKSSSSSGSRDVGKRLSRLNLKCFSKSTLSFNSRALKRLSKAISTFEVQCKNLIKCRDLAKNIDQTQSRLKKVEKSCRGQRNNDSERGDQEDSFESFGELDI